MLNFSQKKLLIKIKDYQSTFTSEAGKRVFLDLMKFCHISEPLCPKKLDPLEMAFAEGQRNVVLYLMKNLNMDSESIQKYFEDQQKLEKERQSEWLD